MERSMKMEHSNRTNTRPSHLVRNSLSESNGKLMTFSADSRCRGTTNGRVPIVGDIKGSRIEVDLVFFLT